jgi:hypothetical protein
MNISIGHMLKLGILMLCAQHANVASAQNRDVEEIVNTGERSAGDASRLTFSAGIDYSTGRYGEPVETEIVISPYSLRYEVSNALSVSASIAAIKIKGPDVVLGPDGSPLPGIPVANRVRSGFGDVGLSATYSIPTGGDSPWLIDATARIKLPTASKESGVTTGKADVSLGLDLSYAAGNWVPFIDLGYRLPGSPTGVELRNAPAVSVGVTHMLKQGAFVFSYDYERALSPFATDSHSLFGALTKPVSKRINITGYGVGGLSSGAPAVEVGLLMSLKID